MLLKNKNTSHHWSTIILYILLKCVSNMTINNQYLVRSVKNIVDILYYIEMH